MGRLLAVVGVVLAIFAAPAFSATKAGDNELTLSGAYLIVSDDDEDMDSLIVQGSYGRFLTDAISVGAAAVGSWSDDDTLLGIDANMKWHFNTGAEVVPYVGPQAGVILWESDTDSETVLSYGAFAGVKYFLKENVNLFAEYNFRMYSLDDDNGGDVMVNALLFGVGVSF